VGWNQITSIYDACSEVFLGLKIAKSEFVPVGIMNNIKGLARILEGSSLLCLLNT
jgi:hypothetical protein